MTHGSDARPLRRETGIRWRATCNRGVVVSLGDSALLVRGRGQGEGSASSRSGGHVWPKSERLVRYSAAEIDEWPRRGDDRTDLMRDDDGEFD